MTDKHNTFLDNLHEWGDFLIHPIILVSSTYHICYINPCAASIYGWDKAKVWSKNLITLLKQDKLPLPVKEEVCLAQVIDTKPIENTIIGKNGNERTFLWTLVKTNKKCPDKGNELFLLQGKEMTREKTLEAKVFELDSIIAQMPGNVYWYNKKFKYLGCNENSAKTIGMSRDETIGKNFEDLMYRIKDVKKELVDNVIEDGRQVLATGKAKLNIEEIPFIGANGKEIHTLGNKVPLKNKQGKIYGVLGISTDITERKRLEEKLRISNAVKKEFIANMSHDFRTPITGIMGMLNDLLMLSKQADATLTQSSRLSTDEKTVLLDKLIHRIETNSSLALDAIESLLQLCNEILEVARLESHTAKVPLEAFEFKSSVQEVVNLLKPAAKDRGLALQMHLDENIPQYLFGSQRYLSKSILNLISNAIKFTEKGAVTLSIDLETPSVKALKKGDAVTLKLVVADTGMGIPKDKFKTIFEHFSRLTPAYEGVYKGSGLGLYTVKQYVEAMKGTITVDSVVGKGTQFTMVLPFTVDDHTDNEKTSSYAKKTSVKKRSIDLSSMDESSQAHDNTRVLVVEDHPLALVTAKSTLKACGCRSQIDTANTGEIALQKASENNYDLILMDIGLPKMQGTEVTQRIRALNDPIKSQVPIVALSGHATEENRKEFSILGMNDLLTKPATNAKMTTILEKYVFPKSTAVSTTEAAVERPAIDKKSKPSLSDQVIDWDASVNTEACRGNDDYLMELLVLLSDEFKASKKILMDAYKAKDTQALRAELHKIRGALTYICTPELERTMQEFHVAVKAEPQEPKVLEETYQAAIKAIDRYQEAFANGFKKEREKSS